MEKTQAEGSWKYSISQCAQGLLAELAHFLLYGSA